MSGFGEEQIIRTAFIVLGVLVGIAGLGSLRGGFPQLIEAARTTSLKRYLSWLPLIVAFSIFFVSIGLNAVIGALTGLAFYVVIVLGPQPSRSVPRFALNHYWALVLLKIGVLLAWSPMIFAVFYCCRHYGMDTIWSWVVGVAFYAINLLLPEYKDPYIIKSQQILAFPLSRYRQR